MYKRNTKIQDQEDKGQNACAISDDFESCLQSPTTDRGYHANHNQSTNLLPFSSILCLTSTLFTQLFQKTQGLL